MEQGQLFRLQARCVWQDDVAEPVESKLYQQEGLSRLPHLRASFKSHAGIEQLRMSPVP